MIEQLNETVAFLNAEGITDPEVGIILGTGLGGLIAEIDVEKEVDYGRIPHFATSTVEFHEGKLIYGKIGARRVLAMQGRFHYYEGYTMEQVTYPVYVMKMMGTRALVISNASGNLNAEWNKGDLMVIEDHINLLPENHLRGQAYRDLGPRFPDLFAPYDQDMNRRLKEIAQAKNIPLHQGVYASVQGPNLETRAEYRYLKTIGADAVGMSTVPEVIAANHTGLPCCAISVLTDNCDPDRLQPVSLDDILATAAKAEPLLSQLCFELIKEL